MSSLNPSLASPHQSHSTASNVWWGVKIAWAVISSLIYIGLVLLAYSKIEGTFQVVLLTLAVFIHQNVLHLHTFYTRSYLQFLYSLQQEFFNLRRTLRTVDSTFDETELAAREKELSEVTQNTLGRTLPQFYIRLAAQGVVFFIGLYNIVTVLVLR